MELIVLENITKTYHLGEVDVPVLRGISLTIDRGEMVALVGASGSGKTTLMNLLGCLDRPSSGQYWLDGQEISRTTPNQRAVIRAQKLGFVFQNFNLLPRTTALNNLLMPLDYAPERPATGAAQTWGGVLLDHVGLAERSDHHPSQMSGGQQQRVAIGRALVNRPALLLADEPTGNLDSRTSEQILQMFRELNREGITVILVTHDAKVAATADRVIRLKDGLVEADERNPPSAEATNGSPPRGHKPAVRAAVATQITAAAEDSNVAVLEPPPATTTQPERSLYSEYPAERGWSLSLALPHSLGTAFGAIQRNVMRSVLTILGVVIGVAAVIAVMEVGQGSNTAMQKTIASMGADNLMVQSGAASSGGVTMGAGSVLTLTPDDALAIGGLPAVAEVAPIVRVRTQLVYGGENWVPAFIYGTTPAFLTVRDWEPLEQGSPFSDNDVASGNAVCVIGQTVAKQFFRDESAVGKEIRIQNISFRVVGVLSRKGANMMGMDQDDIVLAPWTTIKFRVSSTSVTTGNQSASSGSTSAGSTAEKTNTISQIYPGATDLYPAISAAETANTPQPVRVINVDQILVKAATPQVIRTAMEQITELLHDRHRIRTGQPDDFNIRDMTEMGKTLSETSAIMRNLLLVVASVSLVVGGIGIMNIMLVSVTERTREIGLRMAVGARGGHILTQFLTEAVVLCLFGGIVGIGIGRWFSIEVRRNFGWPTEMSWPAIIAAFLVSSTVGIVFGFYPAWKASRLDPIEALRYE